MGTVLEYPFVGKVIERCIRRASILMFLLYLLLELIPSITVFVEITLQKDEEEIVASKNELGKNNK